MSTASTGPACPCDLERPYRQCCGRFHADWQQIPPNPQTLMRSRYSGYVLHQADYLLRTWHPRTRPAMIEPPPPGLKWLGLQLRASGVRDDGSGFVEFVARSRLNGRASRLHEISRFLRLDGRWFYLDGDIR